MSLIDPGGVLCRLAGINVGYGYAHPTGIPLPLDEQPFPGQFRPENYIFWNPFESGTTNWTYLWGHDNNFYDGRTIPVVGPATATPFLNKTPKQPVFHESWYNPSLLYGASDHIDMGNVDPINFFKYGTNDDGTIKKLRTYHTLTTGSDRYVDWYPNDVVDIFGHPADGGVWWYIQAQTIINVPTIPSDASFRKYRFHVLVKGRDTNWEITLNGGFLPPDEIATGHEPYLGHNVYWQDTTGHAPERSQGWVRQTDITIASEAFEHWTVDGTLQNRYGGLPKPSTDHDPDGLIVLDILGAIDLAAVWITPVNNTPPPWPDQYGVTHKLTSTDQHYWRATT